MSVGRGRQAVAVLVTLVLTLGACASSEDGSQISASADGGPVPTTPPLAIPPVLGQSRNAAPTAVATSVPLDVPAADATAIVIPEPAPTDPAATEPATAEEPAAAEAAPAEPAAAPTDPPAATAVPATPVPPTAAPATAVPATAVPATAVPATPAATPAESAQPASEPTQPPAAAAPSGDIIALGDFDVVNLGTRATQNIAELSPSGITMLWFWAPH